MTSPCLPDLHGQNVTLRKPALKDVEARLALGRDPDILEMFGASRDTIKLMTRDDAEALVRGLMERTYAWVIDRGAPIREARLGRVNLEHRGASVAVGLSCTA